MTKVEELFNKNLFMVNYKLKKQYISYFNGDYDECEQELRIILWKACQGWFKNEIYLRGTEGHKYKKPTTFSYHYYGYVRGYMCQRKKTQTLANDNHTDYSNHYKTIEEGYSYIEDFN